MAGCVRNIPTKNCQNLINGFQVTVKNVGDVFLKHSVYTFFVDRPTGQTARRIFTRDGSDNVASRKGQTFLGTKIQS